MISFQRHTAPIEDALQMIVRNPIIVGLKIDPQELDLQLPSRPPHNGADSIELVPSLRPQSADLRPQHLLGQAGGFPQGHSADLSRARSGELYRITPGHDALITQGVTSS